MTNDTKSEYLLVYPNPANSYVCIEVKRNALNSKDYVSIRDVSGKEVKKFEVEGYKMRKIMDGKSFKPGIYFVTLYVNGSSKESVKFTVTH